MNLRVLLRGLSAVGAMLFCISFAMPAQSASVTINTGTTCTSWGTTTDNSGNVTLTCNAGGGGGGGAFTCSLAGAPSGSVTSGTVVSLSMNCSGGTSPYTYQWTGGFAQGATTLSVSNTITATTTFSVTARDSANAIQTASVTVTVGGGGGGGGGAITCTSKVLDFVWSNPQRLLTSSVGGFGPNDIVVVRFTTGANTTAGYGRVTGAEYGDQPSSRHAVLSDTPCDFTTGVPGAPYGSVIDGNTVAMNFTVGANASGYYPALLPNTTYYLNVKNTAGSTCTNTGSCNMYFDLAKPSGL